MNDYSAYKAAKEITIPILVIHDKDDLSSCKSSSIFTII
jgi:hypothetical protein